MYFLAEYNNKHIYWQEKKAYIPTLHTITKIKLKKNEMQAPLYVCQKHKIKTV